jgi:hypothetical protein
MKVKLMAANVDQIAGMRELPPFEGSRRALIRRAREDEEE